VVLAGGFTPTGGDPGVRAVTLSCTSPCAAATWASLPTPLGTARTFAVPDPKHAFVVGNELTSGATHVMLVGADGSATEIPTKVPHTNATAIISPIDSILIVGGNAQIESVLPMMPPTQ
jgi:hypothetical protein